MNQEDAQNKDEQEDADFEIRFYEGLLAKNGDFVEGLMALGDLYTKKGFYEKGLEIDKKLSQLRPDDPFVFYNLACSYSLLHKVDLAFGAMKLAVQNGYDNFVYLEQDQDMSNLLEDPRFQDYLQSVKVKSGRI